MAENNPHSADVDVRSVARFIVGLVAGVIGSALLMWFVFDRYAAIAGRNNAAPDPMELSDPRKEPPEPRLQKAPVMDLRQFRAGEDEVLNSYGWVDPAKGVVRIPVDRAMELVAKEGLR
jgi:hypothetical protein